MHRIIVSSGRDWVLIILFQLHGSRAGLFEGDSFCMGQYDPPPPPPTFILEEELIQYKYNFKQFLSNLSKSQVKKLLILTYRC